jgi:hypothetical protein
VVVHLYCIVAWEKTRDKAVLYAEYGWWHCDVSDVAHIWNKHSYRYA